ncbi:VanW family protein [Melghirimyces algeriensis]|uniref:VanW like protein n=1 Tax=Melghirimyces algeriensis TaxID=910412 RepID=A0A521BRR3_9BACL|nr:VanW family protein [Melghirimyces algeriensis]SMO49230.1 VanW like protein [Melghirimyces algeriensis]
MKALVCILTVSILILGCTPASFHTWYSDPEGSATQTKQPVQNAESRLILQHEEERWELNLQKIGFDGIDPTTLDRDAFYRWFADVEKEINRRPRSAYFENRRIVPHKEGQKVERAIIDHWLDEIHSYMNRPLDIPVQIWKPRITAEMLEHIKEKRLGFYQTVYNPGNKNRTHNIELSVKAIDHHVVNVGDVFSFNQTVGKRTMRRGYRPAKIIVRGEYTEGVGGGICQTSSTLYNSVERAGLRVLQRVSHSKRVTYVPVGQDATVSWGGPDFQFQNQLNRPVLITASAKNGILAVTIWGSQETAHRPKETKEPPKFVPESEEVPSFR